MKNNAETVSDQSVKKHSGLASIQRILSSQWVTLLIICALITGVIAITSAGETNNFSYLFGYHLIYALVVSAIFGVMSRPPLTVMGRLVAFLAILASFVAGDVIAYQRNLRSMIGSKEELKEAMNRVIALGASSGDDANTNTEEKSSGTGSSAVLPAFLERTTKEALASYQEYERSLEASKWQILLDPDRIRRDSDGSETLQIASDAMLALTKHRARMVSLYERMPKDAEAIALPKNVKTQFLKGIQKSLPRARAEMLQALEAEQTIIDSYTTMAQFLRLRRGQWGIQNERLVFSNQKDVDDYSKLVDNAGKAAAIQEKLKNESGSRIRAVREDMEDALK
jgi:hypothetical protein